MQNINLEKLKELNETLIFVSKKNIRTARKLCRKIDRSNGQIHRALIGVQDRSEEY